MRVDLTENSRGDKRIEILLGEMVYVISLEKGKELADWIYEVHPSAKAENERVSLKAKHLIQSINTIRGTMVQDRSHKEVFGGMVYLVDHSHMWALVRNAEDLDALLTEESE